MSIKKTLQKTLIICSIVPLIFVSILAYSLNTNRLLKAQSDTLWQLSKTNGYGLKSLIDTQITEVSLLALQSNINSLLLSHPKLDSTKEQYTKYASQYSNFLLSSRQASNEACLDITLYNKNKEAISSSTQSNIWTSAEYNATLSYISNHNTTAVAVNGLQSLIDSSEKTTYYIEIGAPVYNRNTTNDLIGYVVSTININYLESYLESLSLGHAGVSYIMNKSGQILYHTDSSYLGTITDNKKLKTLISDYYSNSISQSGSFKLDDTSGNRLYGYAVIPDLDWVLILSQDVDEVVQLANINLSLILLTMVIVSIILFLFINYFSKKYTDPIIKLRDATLTASKGNFDVQVDFPGLNEIGDLAQGFNKMIYIIKINYEELTQIHKELVAREDELQEYCKQIEYLAYYDSLTELPNKLAFMNKITRTIQSHSTSPVMYGIYYVDIDNFRNINDTHGYDIGDEVLISASKRIKKLLSSTDMVAKVGEDEFLILIRHLDSTEHGLSFGNRIRTAFLEPFYIQDDSLYLSISIGVSIYPNCSSTPSTLIRQSEIAMYQSKSAGKNKLTLFEPQMELELIRKNEIIEILRKSIKNNEVYVQYQPQVNITSNKIIGFEALMRIESKKLGFISPIEFIPIAEESGLIIPLGEWILREACNYTATLHEDGYKDYVVSVNISPVQLNHPTFLTSIKNILEDTNIRPQCLELEITESTIITNLNNSNTILKELIQLGIRISLDDFGTGYSSLNYLTKMPIHTLKIDKSFIDNISSHEKDSFITETIILLAHQIHVNVIAEGVESYDQLNVLIDKNCDIVQGYLFSKPISETELFELIKNN